MNLDQNDEKLRFFIQIWSFSAKFSESKKL